MGIMNLPILACYSNTIFVSKKLRIYQMLRGYMDGYNEFSYPQGKHIYDLYETLTYTFLSIAYLSFLECSLQTPFLF